MDFQEWLRLWTSLLAVSAVYLAADVIFLLAVLSLEERSCSLTIAEDVFLLVKGDKLHTPV